MQFPIVCQIDYNLQDAHQAQEGKEEVELRSLKA